jgi:hypothetical protein
LESILGTSIWEYTPSVLKLRGSYINCSRTSSCSLRLGPLSRLHWNTSGISRECTQVCLNVLKYDLTHARTRDKTPKSLKCVEIHRPFQLHETPTLLNSGTSSNSIRLLRLAILPSCAATPHRWPKQGSTRVASKATTKIRITRPGWYKGPAVPCHHSPDRMHGIDMHDKKCWPCPGERNVHDIP